MTARHSRAQHRSHPRSNGTSTDTAHVAAVGPTGIYDPVIDGTGIGDDPADPPTHWVRVTCPACGVVRVRASRVVVRNCLDDQTWSYRARCSECDLMFIGYTSAALALPAIAAGLAVESWTLPVPSARGSGAPLQVVDVLEFHLAMLDADWFDQLARIEPHGER